MEVFGNELANTDVLLHNGTELGLLYNILIEPDSGEIRALLFTAREDLDIDVPFTEMKSDVFRVPASKVRAIEDSIIVSS